ncbi:MAG: hypothetical protein J6D45_04125 [Clostridia bacterium]|nr:hypothetical protein [Clostridia bacterium]
MTRTEFLREQTLSGKNKCKRMPVPFFSVADAPYSLPERKALALKYIFDNMPVYIGPGELIVGTRTFFPANKGNEDGHSIYEYSLQTRIPYVNKKDIERFGRDLSYKNKTHFTPDLGIILEKGIGGILNEVESRKADKSLHSVNLEFLSSVTIAYTGLKDLILRYAAEARLLSESSECPERDELLETARICEKISNDRPDTFREAVQLLWFAHLGTIIESFEFINYGRLDAILMNYLGDTPKEDALQIIECLLLKMYDQADIRTTYLGSYAAQLVITLGGILPDGENAVNDVTMLFLKAIENTRLPEPEFNLRISSKNPTEFLDKAAALTISGCNFISYYNDDLFVKSLVNAGIRFEDAACYGFDLCQDINVPGKGDFWLVGSVSLTDILMEMLRDDRSFISFDKLTDAFKERIALAVNNKVEGYNLAERHASLYADGRTDEYFEGIKNKNMPAVRNGCTPMAPLPLLSALYHGCIDNALDVTLEPYPIKEKGLYFGTATEAINSLAAIKKAVYDEKRFTLDEVYDACVSDFDGKVGKLIQSVMWNCPKWGNDDPYVDDIAKDILEFSLNECRKYKTHLSGQVLGGIHQPHPVPNGAKLMATPEGRRKGSPVAVTLTPESGTMQNGPTAVLCSAAKIDPMLIQWNYCVMVNYFASVFKGNNGKDIFKDLLLGYFGSGGLQHQPNVLDVDTLKSAQLEPEKYKDLIVRLWGVSAHFVDLPRELQDEMIARFS